MTPAHQQGYQQRARRARAWALAATTALVAGTLISAPAHAATIARAPVAPSNFTLSATTETTIGLTWTDASNNETRFEVLHQSGTIRTAATNQNSGVWTGLQPDTWNCFRIRAVNAAGASAWQPAATPYWRCARTPTVLEDNYIAFPLQPRTRAHIGDFGLHAGQFRAVTDDNGAGTFTFTNLTWGLLARLRAGSRSQRRDLRRRGRCRQGHPEALQRCDRGRRGWPRWRWGGLVGVRAYRPCPCPTHRTGYFCEHAAGHHDARGGQAALRAGLSG